MQRALSYAQSPAPPAPLRFLLAAPWFGVAGALLLLVYGEQALLSRWAGPTLALTHVFTLGVLAMTMAGSLLQLLPVVAGAALDFPRAAPLLSWCALCAGTLLLAAAFAFGHPFLFIAAGLALTLAFGALFAAVARALIRPAPAAALPMVGGMRLAIPALVVTLALGLSMAAYLAGGPALPLPLLADLHAAWGLVGWVAMLVIGVAFQVIPMFQATPNYPPAVTRGAALLLAVLLLGWSGAATMYQRAVQLSAGAVALCLIGFALVSLRQLAQRKRKGSDATTLYWRLSLVSLIACALLATVRDAPLAVGLLFIAGFAMGAINGMLYKIVPFLLWYHLQQDPRATKGDVPALKTLVPEHAARRQFWWHALALAALLAALNWPALLARPAAALFALANLRLALDLCGAALRCRRIARAFQPS
jgi:hypothetical protein